MTGERDAHGGTANNPRIGQWLFAVPHDQPGNCLGSAEAVDHCKESGHVLPRLRLSRDSR